MENHGEIFRVLSRYYRSGGITVRKAPYLTPAVLSGARIMVPKPLFRSWHAAIPAAALTHENTYAAFRPTILIAGPQSDRVQQFWDGAGNFLAEVPPGTQHSTCGHADLSFTVVLSGAVHSELRQYLEDPATKVAAERKKDDEIAELVRRMRDQVTVSSANPSVKDADDRQAIILAEELLAGYIPRQEMLSAAEDFFFGDDEPISYSTHDLALTLALKFFTQPEHIPQLFEVQLLARVKILQWHREGLLATKLAKDFEEALYELYKPA